MIDVNTDIINTDIINTDIINTDISNYICIDISQDECHECYICYEKCDEISPCECIDLYIHKKCLNTAIEKLNNVNCTICKKQYNNVITKISYYYKISDYGYVILINISVSIMFNLIGCIQFIINSRDNFRDNSGYNSGYNSSINLSLAIPFLSMGSSILLFVLVFWYYMYIKHNLLICKRYEKIDIIFS